MITKSEINQLVEKYETIDFIKDDPIQFPHKFQNKEDIEIAGFISSLLAYGNRKVFIKKLDELFKIMDYKPLEFVLNFKPELLENFNYRFGKTEDFVEIFKILKELYSKDGGLENLFKYGYKKGEIFQVICDYFYSKAGSQAGQGFYFMIPNPKNGGAMKRMCMFLRWMVRKSPVDLGVWDFIKPGELLIPLDTHVAKLSRQMGLLSRNSNDFKAVLELTENLKKYDCDDPVKYDFAMFGYGVNNK